MTKLSKTTADTETTAASKPKKKATQKAVAKPSTHKLVWRDITCRVRWNEAAHPFAIVITL